MKVKSAIRPSPFDVSVSDGNAIIKFAENIIEKQNIPMPRKRRGNEDALNEENTTYYEYDCYTTVVPNRSGLIDDIENNLAEWIEKAKETEANVLADEIRAKRDVLLSETDKEFALDRINLNIPEKVTASTMLNAVKDIFAVLGSVCSGDMARYRQALRDIPQQEGFPFDVKFPVKPNN